MANFLEKYYEDRGWTFLSSEEKGKLSDSILFGHYDYETMLSMVSTPSSYL